MKNKGIDRFMFIYPLQGILGSLKGEKVMLDLSTCHRQTDRQTPSGTIDSYRLPSLTSEMRSSFSSSSDCVSLCSSTI